MVQADGNSGRDGEKCREVRRMRRLRLCVPNGELEQRFVTPHLTMGTTGWKSWLPQKIQKLLLQGCIKRHWTTNKGVNVGEKKNYKRKPITVKWIIFFKSASFFPKLLLVVQAKGMGMKNEKKKVTLTMCFKYIRYSQLYLYREKYFPLKLWNDAVSRMNYFLPQNKRPAFLSHASR